MKLRNYCRCFLALAALTLWLAMPAETASAASRNVPFYGSYYIVQPGDSVWKIAWASGADMGSIIVLNELSEPEYISAGDRLLLPAPEDRVRIDVDLRDQKVRVYVGPVLVRSMAASTGMPGKETPAGTFYVQNRGEWFFNEKYAAGARYWVSFWGWGKLLFHSVPMDANRKLLRGAVAKMGRPASKGCVRLWLRDAKWIYEHIPQGTRVDIH